MDRENPTSKRRLLNNLKEAAREGCRLGDGSLLSIYNHLKPMNARHVLCVMNLTVQTIRYKG